MKNKPKTNNNPDVNPKEEIPTHNDCPAMDSSTEAELKDQALHFLIPPAFVTLKGAGGRFEGKRIDRTGVLVSGELILAACLELRYDDRADRRGTLHSFLPVEATTCVRISICKRISSSISVSSFGFCTSARNHD